MNRSLLAALGLALTGVAAWFFLSRSTARQPPTSAPAERPALVAAPTPLEPRAPPPMTAARTTPPPESSVSFEPGEDPPSADDCKLCLESICSSEIAKGGDLQAALCLIVCEARLPHEMCRTGLGPPQFPKGPAQPVCPGFARTDATAALVRCGKACPCSGILVPDSALRR